MAKDDPHFRLRIPAELKAEIENAAKANNRSINAEIVLRLHESFRSASSGIGSMTIVLEALPPGTPSLKISVGEFMRRFAEASKGPDFVAVSPSGETIIAEAKSYPTEVSGDKLTEDLDPSPDDQKIADKASLEARARIHESRMREVKRLKALKESRASATPQNDKRDEQPSRPSKGVDE